MSAVFEAQAAMQRWLMHGDAGVAALVGEDGRDARLRIYADAYRLRLIEVLGNDYPVLRAWLGEAAFAGLAAGYLHAHPSRYRSVRHFGRDFAAWLDAQDGAGAAGLAAFEWAQGEAFDAADAPALGTDAVAALPAEAWPDLRLRLQPSMRLLRLPRAVPALVEAHGAGRPLPRSAGGEVADWLLWRRDFDVHWRRLEADEAALLAMARDGATFAELCLRLAAGAAAAGAALRAASLLKGWFAEGLVRAVDAAANPPTSD
jgi:hypothetical protein